MDLMKSEIIVENILTLHYTGIYVSVILTKEYIFFQEVSVFVFEKKSVDRYSRHDKEVIIDVLKKGVSQLTRLRHPKILSVLHPLEESR